MLTTNRPIVSPMLVGRTREVEALETALHTVAEGTGQVVLVAGEAGIGKSRLVANLRQKATLDNWTILVGHSFERDTVFPYAPWIDALRAFIGPQPAEVVAELLGETAAELVKLLPELSLSIADLGPTSPLDPEAEQRRLFEVLLMFLARLTKTPRSAPLLVVIEDLHWCDETSLAFVHLLARRVAEYPILLLATYRREEVSSDLRQILTQLDRAKLGREVVLESLNRDDVHTMLKAIFDLKRPVQTEFLEQIYALTEGNPFFVEEVLKALVAAGEVFYIDGGWTRKSILDLHIPPSVMNAVQRRTEQLDAESRLVLSFAAVAGRYFDFALLRAVTGKDESDLLALMKELVSAQLVVEESADRFAFRHALTRQAVYSALLLRERQALHFAICEAFEGVHAGVLDAQVGELSYHYYEAGEWAKALHYASRAGDKAQALNAPRAAVEHYSQAMSAAQQMAQPSSLAPLSRLRGLAYEALGEFEHARTDLDAALALSRAGSDRNEEWRILIDLGQLWSWRDYDQTGDYFQQALALAETFDDEATLGHTLNRIGNWYLAVERTHEAYHCHQKALGIFQTLNDAPGLAQTHDLLGLTTYVGGKPVDGARNLRQSIALFEGLNDLQGLASSLTTLTLCAPGYSTDLVVPADVSAADCAGSIDGALQIARKIGMPSAEAYALVSSGSFRGAQGRYGTALDEVEQGLALAQEIKHRQWVCFALRTLGILYRDLLALPEARQHLEQSLELANEIGSLIHVRQGIACLASLLTAQRDFTQAEALLDSALRPHMSMESLAQRRLWAVRAELSIGQDDPEPALAIIDRLLAATLDAERGDSGRIPYLSRLRGEALIALHQWAEAEATLQAAITSARAQAAPRLVWRVNVDLGRLYRAQGRSADATHSFDTARAVIEVVAEDIHDPALRHNFLHEANALMPRPRSLTPLQEAKQAYGGLTRREREVAALIAEGKSNRAIADTLVLGVRTVEGYVANILAKLGYSSRTQVAVWATEMGMTHEDNGGV